MKFAASLSKLLAALRGPQPDTRARAAALPAPLIVALEPRIVYDASAASIGAAVTALRHDTGGDAHAPGAAPAAAQPADGASRAPASIRAIYGFSPAAAAGANTSAAPTPRHGAALPPSVADPATGAAADKTSTLDPQSIRAIHGFTDAMTTSTDKQVVFIDSNVSDYQTLIAGLPPGTQYVVLDSTKDGLVQIAQYLQQHQGVSAIHLISHGADGNVQVGSTWLNEGDLSAYSTELAQIGAAMKPGGDFLIYGCDVARNADGKALVQQIASITQLNVAASTDATGAAALGGDWVLEYDAGAVHTPVIFSTAAERQYGALLAVTNETYDTEIGYVTPGGAAGVTSFSLGAFTYTMDQAVEFAVDSTTVNQGGTPPLTTGPSDGVLFGNAQGTQLTWMTMALTNGDKMAVQSFDVDTFGGAVTVEGLNSSGSIVASLPINGSTSHVDLSSNAGFSGITTLKFVETDGFFLSPTFNNFTYVDLSSPPVVTASGGTTSFVEADNASSTPVAIDSGITLTDGDATTAKQGTVSITSHFVSGQDSLAFTNSNSSTYGDISASYSSGTGVLTLTSASGTATITQWQNAFRAVTYRDTAVSPNTTTRTISFALTSDAYFSSSNTTTKNVSVTATDQTPIVTTAGHTVTSYPGGSSVAIDSSVTVSDLDNTTQSSGTISVSGGFHSGDTLTFTNDGSTMGNISGSYNAATGVMTLTSSGATATDAQWQHALDAVTFSTTSTTLGNRTISFATNDGTKTSAAATDTVNVANPLTLTADSGSAAFVAGDNAPSTPVVVDPGLTLTDAATGTLASATVTITGNFTSGEDFLQFTNDGSTMGNITAGSFNQITGTLTLTSASSTATLAQWRSALDSIQYTDVAVTPNALTRTVSFTAVDSAGNTSSAVSRNVTVTATDQSPIVTTTGGTAGYVGASSPIAIDGHVTVSDLDNTTQTSATVAVTTGFHSGDVLSFTNDGSTMGNIQASYSAGTGVLLLTSIGGTATNDQWASALSSVTFSSTSTTYGNRTIWYQVNDGTKNSAQAADTIHMTAPPSITTDAGSAAFVAGDNATSTPVAIDAGLTVTDGSATTLASTTVAVTGGFHSGDVLGFTNDGATMGNITGSYNAATGVMTLSSSGAIATLAQWQSALQSITYTNTLVTPDTTTRTIGFTAVDGAGNTSATATRTVTVTDTDQTPIVTTTGGTTNYVGGTAAATIDGAVTVSDLDNTTQSSATVSITTGFHSGDTLAFVNTSSATFGNIVASYNSATGVLTLTSSGATASDAQWSHALAATTFSAASNATPGNRTISFATSDGTKTSAAHTDTVDVLGPPTLTTDSGSAAFVAGDNTASTPVAIDSGLTLTDGSAPTLASATVAITGNLHTGEDVLAFTNTDASTFGNIAASYNGSTGVLTLTSSGNSATLAQWQAALDAVTYSNTAVTPNNATRTVSFTATDTGAFTSNTATRTVTVADTDQTPIVTTTGGTTNYVGGTAAATIDGAVTVSDLDNTTQSSATVSITTGFHSGDTLAFVNTNSATFGNIVASYNAGTGVLTLTSSGATASDAQWSHALSAITFSAGSSATPGNRTISFATNDGTNTSAAHTDTVDVLGPPTIATDSGSAAFVAGDNTAGTPVTIDSGLTLTDGTAPTLASATVAITGNLHTGEDILGFSNTSAATFGNIAASYSASTGVLTLTSAGATATLAQWQAALDAVTYANSAVTPNTATRTVSFTAIDTGAFTSNTATRTVTVADTDQTPTITTAAGTTNYVDGTAATVVNSNVTVSDLDNTTQSSATVAITGNFHSGEDVLAFANTSAGTFGNIVASYNASTGVLTLSSSGATATNAQWSAALSAVTFASSGTDFGNRTIAFATSDGSKTSAAATATVAVLDSPHLATDPGSAAFVAGDNTASTPIVVSPGLTLTGLSSPNLSTATVSITGGFHAGEDVLAFRNDNATMGNIGASYDANTGLLTLSSAGGSATQAQWQAALASITYTDTAVTPATATRVVSFSVTDDHGATSAAQTRSITVTDTDQTPIVIVGGNVTFTSQATGATPVAVAPQVTLSDRDSSTLASAQVTLGSGFDAAHDSLVFTASGATGNIAGRYDASTGVLALSSAGNTATLAQWKAALESVTYANSGQNPTGSRTVSFVVNDGVKTSAVASNTIALVAGASGGTPSASLPTQPPAVVTPRPEPSVPIGSNVAAPDVLNEFDKPLPIGSVPVVGTMTFTDPSAPLAGQSIVRSSVSNFNAPALDAMLDSAMATTSTNAAESLPQVEFGLAQNDPFSIEVATLLPPSQAMEGGASDITVRLADGRSLPGWMHYDAANGALRGKLPPGAHDVRIVVETRDAAGRVARREVVLAPHGRDTSHAPAHPPAHGHAAHPGAGQPVARAALPAGKPSLDQQFARARAALHVARVDTAVRRV